MALTAALLAFSVGALGKNYDGSPVCGCAGCPDLSRSTFAMSVDEGGICKNIAQPSIPICPGEGNPGGSCASGETNCWETFTSEGNSITLKEYMAFDGENHSHAVASIGRVSELGIQSSSFTASAWVYHDPDSSNDFDFAPVFGVDSDRETPLSGLHMGIGKSGDKWGASIKFSDSASNPEEAHITTYREIAKKEWTFIAWQYKMAEKQLCIKINNDYLKCKEGKTNPYHNLNDQDLYMGKFISNRVDGSNITSLFRGKIGAAEIYPGILSPAQIEARRLSMPPCLAQGCVFGDSSEVSGTYLHFPLAGDARDLGPSGLHGTLSAGGPKFVRSGGSSAAIVADFSGSANSIIELPFLGGGANTNGLYSFSGWVKFKDPGVTPSSKVLELGKKDGTMSVYVGNSARNFIFGSHTSCAVTNFWEKGSWVHYAVSVDETSVTVYKNGQLVKVCSASTPIADTLRTSNRLGADFQGQITGVKIWSSKAISSSEALDLFNENVPHTAGRGFQYYFYPLGNDFADHSMSSADGTAHGGVSTVEQTRRYWQAEMRTMRVASFDGTDDYVHLPELAVEHAGPGSEFSACGWVSYSSFSQDSVIFELASAKSEADASVAHSIKLGNDGGSGALKMVSFSAGTGQSTTCKVTDFFAQNSWVHFCVTRSAGGSYAFFKDGSATNRICVSSTYTKPSLQLGERERNYLGTDSEKSVYFNGTMSDLRFWSGKALALSDITPFTDENSRESASTLLYYPLAQNFKRYQSSTELPDDISGATQVAAQPLKSYGGSASKWFTSCSVVDPQDDMDTRTASVPLDPTNGRISSQSGWIPQNTDSNANNYYNLKLYGDSCVCGVKSLGKKEASLPTSLQRFMKQYSVYTTRSDDNIPELMGRRGPAKEYSGIDSITGRYGFAGTFGASRIGNVVKMDRFDSGGAGPALRVGLLMCPGADGVAHHGRGLTAGYKRSGSLTTFVEDASIVSGKKSPVASFYSDSFAVLPPFTLGGGSFSACGRVYISSLSSDNEVFEFSGRDSSTTRMLLKTSGTHLTWSVRTAKGDEVACATDGADFLQINTWTHFCVTVSSKADLIIYKNGAVAKNCTSNGNSQSPIPEAKYTDNFLAKTLSGRMSSLRFWDGKLLTTNDVTADFGGAPSECKVQEKIDRAQAICRPNYVADPYVSPSQSSSKAEVPMYIIVGCIIGLVIIIVGIVMLLRNGLGSKLADEQDDAFTRVVASSEKEWRKKSIRNYKRNSRKKKSANEGADKSDIAAEIAKHADPEYSDDVEMAKPNLRRQSFAKRADKEDAPTGKPSIQIGLTRQKKGILIKLISARNLPSADSNGLSDPFIKAHLTKNDKILKKSVQKSTVKFETLNPNYNEFMFFKTDEADEAEGTAIEFVAMDFDMAFRNDFLGSCRVRTQNIPREPLSVIQWVDLSVYEDFPNVIDVALPAKPAEPKTLPGGRPEGRKVENPLYNMDGVEDLYK